MPPDCAFGSGFSFFLGTGPVGGGIDILAGGACGAWAGVPCAEICAADGAIRRNFGGPVPTGVEGVEMMRLAFHSMGLAISLVFGMILNDGLCRVGVTGVSTEGVGGRRSAPHTVLARQAADRLRSHRTLESERILVGRRGL